VVKEVELRDKVVWSSVLMVIEAREWSCTESTGGECDSGGQDVHVRIFCNNGIIVGDEPV
jgi:hypothetical protein